MPEAYNTPPDDWTVKSPLLAQASNNVEINGHLRPGTIIANNFKVLSFIGAGGMSDVYKCEDLSIGRIIAVKTLQAGFSQDALRRFQTEGKAIAKLEHPNILKLYGLQITPDGLPILLMEFVPGITLARLLEGKQAFTVQRSMRIGGQIGEALKSAENEGIVHRDLKPSNIMILNPGAIDETVKILDFGIAKIQSEAPINATRTGDVFGTPQYMSPEQAMGKKCDGRSDQYSFGCVLFEMLTGAPPYTADNSLSVMMAHAQDPVPSLSKLAKNRIPAHLELAVTRLLQKNPVQRYATMSDALDALFDAKKGSPISKKLLAVGSGLTITGVLFVAAYSYMVGGEQRSASMHKLAESAEHATPVDSSTVVRNPSIKDAIPPARISEPTKDDKILLATLTTQKDVESLKLAGKDVSKFGLDGISKLTKLKRLDLRGCRLVDSQGVSALQKLSLILLNLDDTVVNDDIADTLVMLMPSLEYLDLNKTEITTKVCEKISISRKLTVLNLAQTNIDQHALPYIANISSLIHLNLSGDNVGGQLSELGRLQHLEDLSVKAVGNLTAGDIAAIASFPSLRKLNVAKTNVSDQGLRAISKMPLLKELTVIGCTKITADSVKRFHKDAPNCKLKRDAYEGENNIPNSSTVFDTMPFATTIETVGENLIRNGSFEEGDTPRVITECNPGEKKIAGWQIASGNIDWIGASLWEAATGSCSVELNGNCPGAISQTLITEPGSLYKVSFQASTNPDFGFSDVHKMNVSADGQTETFKFRYPHNNKKEMGWKRYDWLFRAASKTATLKFSSDTPGRSGPCIDDVSVKKAMTKPINSSVHGKSLID
jgi:choice-of-anchor C domain-containing protein